MRALVFLLAVSIAPAASLDQLLPPNCSLVFGLRTSTLFSLLEKQEATKDLHGQITGLLALTPLAGFDPFRDVSEVVLAATATGQNPPSLAVVTGRFNPARIAGNKGQPYKFATLVPGSKPSQTMAVLDETTLLFGDLALVKAAIDRASTNLAPGKLAGRVDEMRSHYDIWAFADRLPPGALPSAAADPLRGLDRFFFGAAFSSDFELTGELHFKTPADMNRIVKMIREIEPQIAPAKFELTTADSTMKVGIFVPEAELKKALAARNKPAPAVSTNPASTAITITGGSPTPQVITRDASGNAVYLTLPGKQ